MTSSTTLITTKHCPLVVRLLKLYTMPQQKLHKFLCDVVTKMHPYANKYSQWSSINHAGAYREGKMLFHFDFYLTVKISCKVLVSEQTSHSLEGRLRVAVQWCNFISDSVHQSVDYSHALYSQSVSQSVSQSDRASHNQLVNQLASQPVNESVSLSVS